VRRELAGAEVADHVAHLQVVGREAEVHAQPPAWTAWRATSSFCISLVALVQGGDPGVARVTLDAGRLEIAPAAVHLDAAVGALHGGLAGRPLGARRQRRELLAPIARGRRLVGEQARHVALNRHVGQQLADPAELRQLAAELPARPGVMDGAIGRLGRDPDGLRGDADAPTFNADSATFIPCPASPSSAVPGRRTFSKCRLRTSAGWRPIVRSRSPRVIPPRRPGPRTRTGPSRRRRDRSWRSRGRPRPGRRW